MPLKGCLSVEEINSLYCTSSEQYPAVSLDGFQSQDKSFLQKSKLVSLRSIVGSVGLLLVGGRFRNANLKLESSEKCACRRCLPHYGKCSGLF